MRCCGIVVSFDSFCEKVHDIGENKVVKYGSNVVGVIPIAGTVVGIVRIVAQTLFRKYQEAGLYEDRPKRDNPVKYSEVKLVQGVAELVPIVGPGIFWTCRGIYLGFKACQNCCSSPRLGESASSSLVSSRNSDDTGTKPRKTGTDNTGTDNSAKIYFPDLD